MPSPTRSHNAVYKRNRKRLLTQAQHQGLTHCPGYDNHTCGRELDWNTSQQPNSPEADHITTTRPLDDSLQNLRILCRTCNNKRGNGTNKPPPHPPQAFPTSRNW